MSRKASKPRSKPKIPSRPRLAPVETVVAQLYKGEGRKITWQQLEAVRNTLGLSLVDWALRLGCSPAHLQMVKRGKTTSGAPAYLMDRCVLPFRQSEAMVERSRQEAAARAEREAAEQVPQIEGFSPEATREYHKVMAMLGRASERPDPPRQDSESARQEPVGETIAVTAEPDPAGQREPAPDTAQESQGKPQESQEASSPDPRLVALQGAANALLREATRYQHDEGFVVALKTFRDSLRQTT